MTDLAAPPQKTLDILPRMCLDRTGKPWLPLFVVAASPRLRRQARICSEIDVASPERFGTAILSASALLIPKTCKKPERTRLVTENKQLNNRQIARCR